MQTGQDGCLFSILFAALLWPCAVAASGEPDASFGTGGQVMIPRPEAFQNANAAVGDIETLPDGRVLWAMEDGVGGMHVGRLLRDGSVDSGFGNDGRVRLTDCTRSREVRLVADASGGLVIWSGACLLRLNAVGVVDPGFAAGSTMPPSESPLLFRAAELLRDSQGRWLLAGIESGQWRVYRFLPEGGNDPGFGVAGVATPVIPATQNTRDLLAMTLRPDDGVVLVGSRRVESQSHLTLFQLDANGAPDTDFGNSGFVSVAPPAGYQGLIGEAVLRDGDGSLIVAGQGRNSMTGCCVMLARFDAEGTVPPASLSVFPLGSNVSLSPFGETSSTLALLPQGKILLARNSFPPFQPPLNTRTRFTLIRFHADGALDTSFDDDGWRSYLIADPVASGQSGAYVQIHGMSYAEGKAMLFGRTFFEDNALGVSYATFMRVLMDVMFDDGFES
jgi:uncharacterized delta-60 repeat protein